MEVLSLCGENVLSRLRLSEPRKQRLTAALHKKLGITFDKETIHAQEKESAIS